MKQNALFDSPGPRGLRLIRIATLIWVLCLLLIGAYVVWRLDARGQLAPQKWLPFVTNIKLLKFLGDGLLQTLSASLVALVLSLLAGVVLAMGRALGLAWLSLVIGAYVQVFRGIPVLLNMLFLFLGVPLVLHLNISAYTVVVIALLLYNSAVIAEIMRAGIAALPAGQRSASLALGFSEFQTLRHVLVPQAIRLMIPALISQFIIIIKDSALGFIVGFHEMTAKAQNAALQLGNPLQTYIVIGVVYVAINLAVARMSHWIAHRKTHAASGH
ncbi:amino acid ABC transporter permease [Castellaniella sp.]|uniref:amino acid ABC transporter permease n=1 Tax=Castellaniella sp. TaxID=1955812 RepID=UPI00355F49D4